MMSKNYYKEIANMLGLELYEEFGITNFANYKYKINENGLYRLNLMDGQYYKERFDDLDGVLKGDATIVKKPYKPRMGDQYYGIGIETKDDDVCVTCYRWRGCTYDLMAFSTGNCFRTKEEAEEHKDEIIKKLKEHYENS